MPEGKEGVKHFLIKERNKIGVPAEKSLIFRWGIYSGQKKNPPVWAGFA